MEPHSSESLVRVLVHLMNGVVEVHTFTTMLGAAVFLGHVADRQPDYVRVTVCDGAKPLYASVKTEGGWVEERHPPETCRAS